ncbi:MAG: hypothetical protein QXL17_02875 [Candidatus Thermoplasmatota archaeon]
MQITHQQAIELMKNSNTFFTVTFVKRTNGEVRKMNCRINVHKFDTGVGMKYDPDKKNLLSVWERRYDSTGADNYRNVNLNELVELVINNNKYEVVHKQKKSRKSRK